MIVLGQPNDPVASDTLVKRCVVDGRLLAIRDAVPEHELQLYLKAADCVVLPPGPVAGIGSILDVPGYALALTFGRPLVTPLDATSPPPFDPAYSTSYERGNGRSLRDALLAATSASGWSAQLAARRAGERYRPEDMARDYAGLVAGIVGGTAAGVTPQQE